MFAYYRIAGIGVRVSIPDGRMYQDAEALKPFVNDGPAFDYDLTIRIVESLPEPEYLQFFQEPGKRIYYQDGREIRYIGSVEKKWQQAYLRTFRQGTCITAQILASEIKEKIIPGMVLNSLGMEHIITEQNGFLLHASYILWDGRAILFTAPSGTGKSTQADLWCRLRNAELINGDRAAVRMDETGVSAWGVPFSGSSGVGKNVRAPLAAVVYLSQAPSTTINRLTGLRAFRQVWEGCCVNVWNRSDMEHCVQTVTETVSQVPVYHLSCTPDESAVAALEEMLKQQG